jgi:hypothetical protein
VNSHKESRLRHLVVAAVGGSFAIIGHTNYYKILASGVWTFGSWGAEPS